MTIDPGYAALIATVFVLFLLGLWLRRSPEGSTTRTIGTALTWVSVIVLLRALARYFTSDNR